MEVNQEKPVWLVLLLVGVGALAGLLMGGYIGLEFANLLYAGEGDLSQAMLNPSDNNLRVPFLVMQGMTSLGGFLIAPYFIWKALTKNSLSYFNLQPLQPLSLLVAAGLVISFAVADSAIIEWNQNLTLPDFLKEIDFLRGIEELARNKENDLADLTKMITNFQSFGEFALAFIVVGVLAGICEEFLFRGIVQRELWRGSGNIHVAIWVSALIFSAIHVQFFGFVPRVLLGALFGYLYYWSGNLIVPIAAHLFNNGFSLIMLYLFQQKIINTDIEKPEAAPWPAVIVCALISIGLLYYFKKTFFHFNSFYPLSAPQKKFSNLPQRLATALLGAFGIIFGVVYSEWTYLVIFFIICFFSLREFYKLSGLDGMIPQKTFGTICGLTIFFLSFFIERGSISRTLR